VNIAQLIAISSGENDDFSVDGMFVFIPKPCQTKPLVGGLKYKSPNVRNIG
jgi:hypothetical protein